MKRSLVVFAVLAILSTNVFAGIGLSNDDKPEKESHVRLTVPKSLSAKPMEVKKLKAQPDVPGSLVIDLGFTFLLNRPESINLQTWGSFALNFAYMYEFVIGESNFSFNIGPGIGIERFRFKESVTLGTILADEITIVEQISEVLPNANEFKRSVFEVVYIDVPMEFRYHFNKYDFKRSIKLTIGGKVGYRIDSKTKIVYKEFDNNKKLKSKERYNFENFRYGAYARFGWRGIGVFYYYSFSPLWRNNRGPEMTDANSSAVGITLIGF